MSSEKLGAGLLFVVCLAVLILNRVLHLEFTKGADIALIAGCVLGGLGLLDE